MKKTIFFTFFIATTLCSCLQMSVFTADATSYSLDVHSDTERKEVIVDVSLDAEGDNLNAYEGQLQYDEQYLYVKRIETNNSIVDTWVTYPEKYNTELSRNDISFEGVTDGGFSGIVMPDSVKREKGKLFSVVFSVLKEGGSDFYLHNTHVYKSDGLATEVFVGDARASAITSPSFVDSSWSVLPFTEKHFENPRNDDLFAMISSSTELYDGRDFVMFANKNTKKSILSFEVSESPSSDPRRLPGFSWTEAKSPYLLTESGFSKYVHVRANYTDGSYSYVTLKTVEKNVGEESLSYILMLVTLLVLTISYVIFFADKKE
jgi:hypothetical protein